MGARIKGSSVEYSGAGSIAGHGSPRLVSAEFRAFIWPRIKAAGLPSDGPAHSDAQLLELIRKTQLRRTGAPPRDLADQA